MQDSNAILFLSFITFNTLFQNSHYKPTTNVHDCAFYLFMFCFVIGL